MAKIPIPYNYQTVEEYPRGVRLEKYQPLEHNDEYQPRFGEVRYRAVAPNSNVIPEFDQQEHAELWIAVYFAVGGFSAEGIGERGIPPEVAADGREAQVAYLVARPGASTTWATRLFDVSRETVHSYCSRVRSRAREARAEFEDSADASE